jgi:hypothetical protein
VKRSNSLYKSPLFCVPKKQGHGLRIVQDFSELDANSHIDRYSMKEITECIGDMLGNFHNFFNLGPYFWLLENEAG